MMHASIKDASIKDACIMGLVSWVLCLGSWVLGLGSWVLVLARIERTRINLTATFPGTRVHIENSSPLEKIVTKGREDR